jgi:hypothetical protein
LSFVPYSTEYEGEELMIRSLQLWVCPLFAVAAMLFDASNVNAGFLVLGLNVNSSEAEKHDPASTPPSRVANVNPRGLDSHYLVTSGHRAAQSSLPGRRPFAEEAAPAEASSVVTQKINKVGARSLKSRMN